MDHNQKEVLHVQFDKHSKDNNVSVPQEVQPQLQLSLPMHAFKQVLDRMVFVAVYS